LGTREGEEVAGQRQANPSRGMSDPSEILIRLEVKPYGISLNGTQSLNQQRGTDCKARNLGMHIARSQSRVLEVRYCRV
jgi:hypothetical protein